jgi:hypothetical protein
MGIDLLRSNSMKKKYRIKTWDELKSMEGVRPFGISDLMFEGCCFAEYMKCLSGKIIEMDFNEDNNSYHFHDVGYVWKWMCEELPQFKEGDLVLVKDNDDEEWMSSPEEYLMTKKDGIHLTQLSGNVESWDEIKPYTKPTTALEDLIDFKKAMGPAFYEQLDEIIKKLKLEL